MSDKRSAGLDEGGRHDERPRRGVRMGERRGVHHDPGHQRRRERPVAGAEVHSEASRKQGHHLAGRGRLRVDPVGFALRVVRGVVVDDDPGQPFEQVGVPGADLADPLERPAIGEDREVVRRIGIRVEP